MFHTAGAYTQYSDVRASLREENRLLFSDVVTCNVQLYTAVQLLQNWSTFFVCLCLLTKYNISTIHVQNTLTYNSWSKVIIPFQSWCYMLWFTVCFRPVAQTAALWLDANTKFLLPLDGMLFDQRTTPPPPSLHKLHSLVKRGTVRVPCLKTRSEMISARAQSQIPAR